MTSTTMTSSTAMRGDPDGCDTRDSGKFGAASRDMA